MAGLDYGGCNPGAFGSVVVRADGDRERGLDLGCCEAGLVVDADEREVAAVVDVLLDLVEQVRDSS